LFEDACEWDYLTANPFKPKNPTRRDRQRKKLDQKPRRWHDLTPKQYLRLLEAAPSLRWRCLYAVAYTAGLRRAELANLQRGDINFDDRELEVRPREATPSLPPFQPKTTESIRKAPVPQHTLDLLAELRRQKHEQGGRVVLNPFALLSDREYEGVRRRWKQCQESDTPWSSRYWVNNWLTNFRRHVKKAGIQPEGRLALHDLRKACIRNWADHLPPKATQDFAGHADAKTTMAYYNQTTPEHRRKAAVSIDRMLRKSDAGLTPEAKIGG
jgi:integrase